MPATIAPIQHARNNAVKPAMGPRFGNFESVVHLPPIKVQSSRGSNSFSDLNNQKIYRTVCDWVDVWQQWQQKILLYSVANRSSRHQLEILATCLEPLRHHDGPPLFRYHSRPASLQKQSIKTASFPRASTQEKLPPVPVAQMQLSGINGRTNKLPRLGTAAGKGAGVLTTETGEAKLPSASFAMRLDWYATSLSSSVVLSAFKEVLALCRSEKLGAAEVQTDTKTPALTLGQYASLLSSSVIISAINETVITENIWMHRSFCHSPLSSMLSLDQYADLLSTSVIMSAINEMVVTGKPENETRNITEEKDMCLGKEPSPDFRSQKEEESLSICVLPGGVFLQSVDTVAFEVPAVSRTAEGPADSLPSPLITREETRNGTRMSAQFLGGCISFSSGSKRSGESSQKARSQTGSSHYRYSSFASTSVRTPDFFAMERTSLLGPKQHKARPGGFQWMAGVGNIPVPLQQTYKNRAWWSPAPLNGRFHKANRREMITNFREQLATISEWLHLWESHERLGLLKEVVKKCGVDVLESFVSYIDLKLRDTLDINMLPDSQLLYVFSHLPPGDILNCAKVCRRWRYLCVMDDVWIIKCLELGEAEGIENLPLLIQSARSAKMGVDWMRAFVELCKLVEALKEDAQYSEVSSEQVLPEARTVNEEKGNDCLKGQSTSGGKIGASTWQVGTSSDKPAVGRLGQLTVEERDDESAISEEDDLATVMEDYNMTEGTDGKMLIADQHGWEKGHHRIFAASFEYKVKGTLPELSSHDPAESVLEERFIRSAQTQGHSGTREEEDNGPAHDMFTDLAQSSDLLGKVVPAVKLEWETPEASRKLRQHSFPVGFVYSVKRIRKLQGHAGGVSCLQFDRRRLVTGGADHLVRLWNVRNGRILHVFHGHKGGVRCAKFDNEILLTGSWDSVVIVWDIRHFTQRAVLRGHDDSISCLCLSKEHIISGSHDHMIRVWDRATFICIQLICGHSGPVLSIVANAEHVFSSSADLAVRMTDISSGVCVRVFERLDQNRVLCLSLSGFLLLGGDTQGRVCFWNVKTGEAEAAVSAHRSAVNAVTYHKGRFYTGSSDGTVTEYDLMTMTCIRVLRGHRAPVRAVQVSDRRCASCGDDGTVRVWELRASKASAEPSQPSQP